MTYDINSFLENNLKPLFLTSTAGLCASMTTNVTTITTDDIHIGNPLRITRQVDQYPCLIINPKNNTYPIGELGQQSLKSARDPEVFVDIYCMTQCMSDSEDSDKQARLLARNVCNVLEANQERNASTSTVEDGWHNCTVENAIYDGSYQESSQTYQSSVKLECRFKSWSIR